MPSRNERLVWMDLEMTGLDIDKESIIEIATVITDEDLNIIAEGPNLAINVPEDLLLQMDEWNTKHHHESGLVERIRTQGVDIKEAERQTLDFLKEWVDYRTAPLCGNSIWNDRRFLQKEMNEVSRYLHYRMIDVSTIKELRRRWYPGMKRFQKKGAHLARDDILESIAELKAYKDEIFKNPSSVSS